MITDKKCVRVGLVGEPNVGKSTLVNCIIGEKVSIVTPKAQTTRNIVRGVINKADTQIILVDMPGIFRPSKLLEKYIVKNAMAGIEESDIILVLINAKRGMSAQLMKVVNNIKDKPLVMVINKIDLIDKHLLLELTNNLSKLNLLKEIFMVSALKNDGIDWLINYIAQQAPIAPWFYNQEIYVDQSSRELAEEVTREQLFLLLNKELPYSLKVETESWEEIKGGLKIHQAIVVVRNSHKGIVVGARAQKIKEVGERARAELIKIFDCKIHLFLYVKVREDWIEKDFGC